MRLDDGNLTTHGEIGNGDDERGTEVATDSDLKVIAYIYGLARKIGGTGYRQWREIWVRAVDVQDAGDVLIVTSDYNEKWEFPKPLIRRLKWYEET